jgi:hypothetical protein
MTSVADDKRAVLVRGHKPSSTHCCAWMCEGESTSLEEDSHADLGDPCQPKPSCRSSSASAYLRFLHACSQRRKHARERAGAREGVRGRGRAREGERARERERQREPYKSIVLYHTHRGKRSARLFCELVISPIQTHCDGDIHCGRGLENRFFGSDDVVFCLQITEKLFSLAWRCCSARGAATPGLQLHRLARSALHVAHRPARWSARCVRARGPRPARSVW